MEVALLVNTLGCTLDPWGLSDRDFALHGGWSQDACSLGMVAEHSLVDSFLAAAVDGHIRVVRYCKAPVALPCLMYLLAHTLLALA